MSRDQDAAESLLARLQKKPRGGADTSHQITYGAAGEKGNKPEKFPLPPGKRPGVVKKAGGKS